LELVSATVMAKDQGSAMVTGLATATVMAKD